MTDPLTSDVVQTDCEAPQAGSWRPWGFRFAALLVGLLPFLLLEAVCVLFDWGRPSLHADPFVGFRSTRPLFVLDDDGRQYRVPKARQSFFPPESFAAVKPRDEFRIFVLGGSTVEGEPFGPETSFSTWLQLSLRAADPSRRWEVVNCGGVSYATYRLAPILEEVLRYEPDLVIVCEGHNEFLEDREFEHIQRRGQWVNASLEVASRLRSFTLAREAYLRLRGVSLEDRMSGRTVLPTEVEALLDYQGGLEEYHRDDARRDGVVAHYRFNLERMIGLAREADVEIMLVNPVSNLCDSPPFKSEHRADLSTAELDEWQSLCEQARECLHAEPRDLNEATRLFKQACQLDPLHAGGFYNLAKCYDAAGDFEQAREAYLHAKDLDVCPLRILRVMNQAVLEIAEQTGTALVDADRLFSERSRHGIVGGDWLVDHVHPTVEGHRLLAATIAEKLVELGQLHPQPGWKQAQQERFREHYDSLGDYYFLRGTARLERLRAWAHGRVDRLKPTASGGPPLATSHADKP